MNNLEDQIRDMYRAWTDTVLADELPLPGELRAPHARRAAGGSHRARAFAPLAAAAAVLVTIGLAVSVPRLASSPGHHAASSGSATSGATPPFVVILNRPDSRGYQGPLEVVSAATGRITGKVPVPRKNSTWYDVAVTGSSTKFVLAATGLASGLCNPTYLYTLTLSASGAPAALTPFSDPVISAELDSIAGSADGGTVAFTAVQCHSPDQAIGIIRGRTVKTWQEQYPLFASSLSLSADGSMLGYTEGPVGREGGKVRLLDTSSAPGSTAVASKVVFTYPADARVLSAIISPDSTTTDVMWITGPDGYHLTTTLAGYRLSDGQVQGTLFRRTMPKSMYVSRAGGRLLVWEPGSTRYLVDPITGKATRLRAAWANSWEIYW